MAPHSSTLAWKIPWMEEPGGLQSIAKSRTRLSDFHSSLSCIGEGSGNPLQCPCLENPRDGGVKWAAVCWVAQSPTWLKQLSSRSSSSTEFAVLHNKSLSVTFRYLVCIIFLSLRSEIFELRKYISFVMLCFSKLFRRDNQSRCCFKKKLGAFVCMSYRIQQSQWPFSTYW